MSQSQAKERTTHGGPNRGQGRHFLDDSKPGEGIYATRHTITLPPSMAEYLIGIGGSLSKGVRIAAQYHQSNEAP